MPNRREASDRVAIDGEQDLSPASTRARIASQEATTSVTSIWIVIIASAANAAGERCGLLYAC
jgi:hypothetical protein